MVLVCVLQRGKCPHPAVAGLVLETSVPWSVQNTLWAAAGASDRGRVLWSLADVEPRSPGWGTGGAFYQVRNSQLLILLPVEPSLDLSRTPGSMNCFGTSKLLLLPFHLSQNQTLNCTETQTHTYMKRYTAKESTFPYSSGIIWSDCIQWDDVRLGGTFNAWLTPGILD